MTGFAERFRKFRAETLAKINPPGRQSCATTCGYCGGPAGLVFGRNTGREFAVPSECFHHPYPVEDGPRMMPGETGMGLARFCVTTLLGIRHDECTVNALLDEHRASQRPGPVAYAAGSGPLVARLVELPGQPAPIRPDARAAHRRARKARRMVGANA